MTTVKIEVQAWTIWVLVALVVGLLGGFALATQAGTASRWVNNELIFDGNSGNDAFQFDVNGLRAHFGTGTNDYCYSDGTSVVCSALSTQQITLTDRTSYPAAPASGNIYYSFIPDSGWPGFPMDTSSWAGTGGVPLAIGWNGASTVMPIPGDQNLWLPRCSIPDFWAVPTTYVGIGLASLGVTCTEGSTNGAWDAGSSWFGRQRWNVGISATAANSAVDCHMQGPHSVMGSNTSSGGFIWWGRACINRIPPVGPPNIRVFFGLERLATALGSIEPSNLDTTIYFGCDPTDTNLSVCSNGNDGTAATCNTLGSAFPCKVNGACYDMWFADAPGSSSVVAYYIRRLPDTDDTPHTDTASGLITTDLPAGNFQLVTHLGMNNADSGVAISMAFDGTCTWDHW